MVIGTHHHAVAIRGPWYHLHELKKFGLKVRPNGREQPSTFQAFRRGWVRKVKATDGLLWLVGEANVPLGPRVKTHADIAR